MKEIMANGDIAFPNLGIYLENVPKGFSVFGFEVTFYGMIIGLGILGGIFLAALIAKRTGQDPELYWDFSVYVIISSIVGARLYYVAFTWDNYKDDLLSIFNTRQGGLAIYGGVIAAFLTLAVYAKIKKSSFLLMVDTAVPGLLLGQLIGRYGNFMNREVFGGYTDNIFAMRLPIEAVRQSDITQEIAVAIVEGTNYIQVHPTFLYESLWNLMLLIVALVYWKHKKFVGEICLLYLGGYGIGRFWIEGIRTDQLLIGTTGIAVSQMLGLVCFLFAIVCVIYKRVTLYKSQKNRVEVPTETKEK